MSDDQTKSMGTWIAIGIALGVGIGAAMDNIAVGIALGAALGAALSTAVTERRKKDAQSSGAQRGGAVASKPGETVE
jgi:hypothetical protein